MNYRFEGRQKTLAFGSYPDVSLAKAREKRTAAREALAEGLDPFEVKKAKAREAKAKSEETFKAIGEEWFTRLELQGRAPRTLEKMRWLLDMRSEEHTSELQSLMRISYAVFCLTKKKN